MATHSSVLAWRIPGTGEPGGLPSIGLQSRTRLKQLSSSSSGNNRAKCAYVILTEPEWKMAFDICSNLFTEWLNLL